MKHSLEKTGKSKSTRDERAARTRQKLIEATIECLAELGYARMSTNDVVRKTGLSRGALSHHFPNKAFLVAEAAAFLINRRIRYSISKLEDLDPNSRDLRTEVWTRWKAYEKWFPANIEFMVAARTDPELTRYFSEAIARSTSELMTLQKDSFRHSKLTNYVVGCFVRGLCLEALVNPDEIVDEIFEEFVRIMSLALSETPGEEDQPTTSS